MGLAIVVPQRKTGNEIAAHIRSMIRSMLEEQQARQLLEALEPDLALLAHFKAPEPFFQGYPADGL